MQAARILAQLLVSGGTMVFRAATQAYRQALISELKENKEGPIRTVLIKERHLIIYYIIRSLFCPHTDGQKAGITPEMAKAAAGRASKLNIDEARLILGVDASATREEITKKFEHLMKVRKGLRS